MDLKLIGWEDADWIHVAEFIVQWRALVNTIMNLRMSYKARNCRVAKQLVSSLALLWLYCYSVNYVKEWTNWYMTQNLRPQDLFSRSLSVCGTANCIGNSYLRVRYYAFHFKHWLWEHSSPPTLKNVGCKPNITNGLIVLQVSSES
jgi:hypothetical protein